MDTYSQGFYVIIMRFSTNTEVSWVYFSGDIKSKDDRKIWLYEPQGTKFFEIKREADEMAEYLRDKLGYNKARVVNASFWFESKTEPY